MLNEIKAEATQKMDKAIEAMLHDFKTIRTGNASIAMLDNILIECYGDKMPINQLANLSTPEARTILIDPWDKSSIGNIEKGILKSDLNLTPSNDGKVIRLNIPQLTEERRKEFVKHAKHRAEEAKVSIRNIRRDANDHIKSAEKEEHISQNDVKHSHDDIQKLTDKYIEKIVNSTEKKEKEIMEV